MDSSILWGLVSAFAYGLADYVSQTAGRILGAWRACFIYYALGLAALSIWIPLHPLALRQASEIPLSGWLISVASGLSLLAAVVLFTQGLIKGSIAVVVPVTASYGAVTTVLSALAGEHFTPRAGIGIALTIAGACGAAIPAASRSGSTETSSGAAWALAAALAYGLGFWLQGLAVPVMGPLLPVWAVYATGVVAMVVLHTARTIDVAFPHPLPLMAPGVVAAILSIVAFLALTTGLATGRIAVVIVLSSLTSAVTVILARLLQRAAMGWHQWIALASVLIGLGLLRQ